MDTWGLQVLELFPSITTILVFFKKAEFLGKEQDAERRTELK